MADFSDLDYAVMAAKLNGDCVKSQQRENARLRGVIAKLQASRKAMKGKLDKASKAMARARAKGKKRG